MKHRHLAWILCMFIAFTTTLQGQVTIGSGQPPLAGALLDLKQDGTTTKGLGLPKVALSAVNQLEPCATTNSVNKDSHVGLLLYNTTNSAPLCEGIYVWNGDEWEGIQKKCNPYIRITDPANAILDFGTSQTSRTVQLKTNTKWKYQIDAQYASVVHMEDVPFNTVQPGGTYQQEGSAQITFSPNPFQTDPAGTQHQTTLTFTTEDHGSEPQDTKNVILKREIPSRFVFENVTPANASILAPTATTVSVQASSNDIWQAMLDIAPAGIQTSLKGVYTSNTLTLSLPAYTVPNTTRTIDVQVIYNGITTSVASYTQEGPSLRYVSDNVPSRLYQQGGEYTFIFDGYPPENFYVRAMAGSQELVKSVASKDLSHVVDIPKGTQNGTDRNVKIEYWDPIKNQFVLIKNIVQDKYFLIGGMWMHWNSQGKGNYNTIKNKCTALGGGWEIPPLNIFSSITKTNASRHGFEIDYIYNDSSDFWGMGSIIDLMNENKPVIEVDPVNDYRGYGHCVKYPSY